MAERKSRAAARKIDDQWKGEGVVQNLLAPEMFNKQLLGETPMSRRGRPPAWGVQRRRRDLRPCGLEGRRLSACT